MIEDDEDFLFGEDVRGVEGLSSSSDSDSPEAGGRTSGDVGDRRRMHIEEGGSALGASGGLGNTSGGTTASSRQGGNPTDSDSESDNDTNDGDHFLDREVDCGGAARSYIDRQDQPAGAACAGGSTGPKPLETNIVCGCSMACLRKFTQEEIDIHRLNMQEMEKEEKELIIMGVLMSTQFEKEASSRGKRKHQYFAYSFQGEKVCAGAFRFIYDIGKKAMRNLKLHLEKNGPVPRRHGNLGRRPHNAFLFNDVERCVQFLKSYAEQYGLPHPAPLHGRADMPPTYLPASKTIKSMHAEYVASCTALGVRAAGVSVFRSIWTACLPHIKSCRQELMCVPSVRSTGARFLMHSPRKKKRKS